MAALMKCVLHIGPPKTGSTSIQFFLQENRERLRDRGIFVPQTRKPTQQEFSLLTLDDFDESRPRIHLGIYNLGELRERQAQIRPDLERQMNHAQRSCQFAIISCEELADRSVEEINRLRVFLSPYVSNFTVVGYLRRQDLLEVSLVKYRLRNRDGGARVFQQNCRSYADMLDRWATVFGESNVAPIVFTDSALEKVDHIESFLRACGLTNLNLDTYAMPGIVNSNWDARALQMLELVNEFIPPVVNGERPSERKVLERVLARGFPDHVPYRPRRAEAQEYFAGHAEDNEKVRRRWFPDRPALFHEDFSMYPAADPKPPSLRDFAYVLAELAKFKVRRKPEARD
jgi:hypothetical protein